jgi:NADPH:quinone reductase-like Zn-dependent oxidoreductase
MKAIVQDKYGSPDVLELGEIDRPAVGENGLLVRVHAAAVNAGDWRIMRGLPYITRLGFGLRGPRVNVRGLDVAGTVEVVGKNVTQFQPGDEVFGWCLRAFAEFVYAGEKNFVSKPENFTFEQAAAVPGAAFTALHGLRDRGEIQPGQKVLINGAGGGIGTFGVQIAKSFGAHVTGVCSTAKLDLVRSIGADEVVHYTEDDFTQSGQRYDLILDIPANRSLSDCRRALTPRGTYVLVGGSKGRWLGPLGRVIRTLLVSPLVRQRLRPLISQGNNEDLVFLKELIECGKVTPIVGRTYALSEVPEAIRHLEEGHAEGKVVITI